MPVWSARSQARGVKPGVKGDPAKGVQMVFEQGGYPHQFSYEHPWARWALLHSIVQIVKNVKDTEEVSQSFTLMPGRPALLVIQMRNALNSDQRQSLTKTLPELRAQLDRLPGSYRILREGKRTIAGIEAEEVLFAVKAGDITAYRFYLFAPGNPGTLAKPNTSVQLLFGAVRSDMAPEEATSPVDETGAPQTGDTLLNSLRLRPGAV